MPLRKKNKIRNKVLFWTAVAATVFLMVFVPKPPAENSRQVEYELH
jgi:hypothetical protein